MKTEKLGQEPIIPTVYRQIGENEFRVANEKDLKDPYSKLKTTEGISKRLYIATAAIQGIVNAQYVLNSYLSPEDVAREAFKFADEMLKQEEVTE